jgi:hypothetical protein
MLTAALSIGIWLGLAVLARVGGQADIVKISFPSLKSLDYEIGPQNKKEITLTQKSGKEEKVELNAKESLFNNNFKVFKQSKEN